MEREAKIFESGNYEDKGISVSEEDLQKYVNNFKPCPVKLEHADTAFDGVLGTLKKIYKKGKELFGIIDFSEEAWNLIEKAHAKKLSISLNPDNYSISEISIVQNPRVEDARVFAFALDFLEENLTDYEILKKENQKLKYALSNIEAEKLAEKFFSEGKLTPATKNIAIELFKCDSLVRFGENNIPVTNLFEAFLEKLPKQIPFGELEKPVSSESKFSDEQIEYAHKLGVNLGGK